MNQEKFVQGGTVVMGIRTYLFMILSLFCVAISVNAEPTARPNEWIVSLNLLDQAEWNQSLQAWSNEKKTIIESRPIGSSYVWVKGQNLKNFFQQKSIQKIVRNAEPNWIYHRMTANSISDQDEFVTNDPLQNQLWGLANSGSGIRAGAAWRDGFRGDRSIKVAVIDTGIDMNHPDLRQNIYVNPNEIPGNNIDDDGNGYIDDVSGWNFVSDRANSTDDQGHGTHCAGTIGAGGDNSMGVVGVAWNVSLVPIKFLDNNGSGSLEGAIRSIQYATKMGVQIMSNSWGGGGFSSALLEVILEARDRGILFVAAAGNDRSDNDSRPSYPASYPADNIISVAAIDSKGVLASFSNSGKRSVHIAAPGVGILSTSLRGKYESLSGTSMATPHVSGAAAVLWAIHPEWTYSQVKDRLIDSRDSVPALEGRVISGGRLNLWNAIRSQDPALAY